MTDPTEKEYQSLDELFRKTFDGLPDTPAPSGWDVPSGQVWQHVKTRIEPPRTGWTTQTLTLVSAFAVTVAVGLYLYFAPGDQPATPAIEVPKVEQPVVVPAAPEPAVIVTSGKEAVQPVKIERQRSEKSNSVRPVSPTVPVDKLIDKPAAPTSKPTQPAKAENNRPRAGEALPLPGSKPDSPNTRELLKNEAWRKPLSALPLQRQRPAVPVIPATLKFQFPKTEN